MAERMAIDPRTGQMVLLDAAGRYTDTPATTAQINAFFTEQDMLGDAEARERNAAASMPGYYNENNSEYWGMGQQNQFDPGYDEAANIWNRETRPDYMRADPQYNITGGAYQWPGASASAATMTADEIAAQSMNAIGASSGPISEAAQGVANETAERGFMGRTFDTISQYHPGAMAARLGMDRSAPSRMRQGGAGFGAGSLVAGAINPFVGIGGFLAGLVNAGTDEYRTSDPSQLGYGPLIGGQFYDGFANVWPEDMPGGSATDNMRNMIGAGTQWEPGANVQQFGGRGNYQGDWIAGPTDMFGNNTLNWMPAYTGVPGLEGMGQAGDLPIAEFYDGPGHGLTQEQQEAYTLAGMAQQGRGGAKNPFGARPEFGGYGGLGIDPAGWTNDIFDAAGNLAGIGTNQPGGARYPSFGAMIAAAGSGFNQDPNVAAAARAAAAAQAAAAAGQLGPNASFGTGFDDSSWSFADFQAEDAGVDFAI